MYYLKQLGILSVLMSLPLFTNVAFAQVVSLSNLTRDGATVRFTINLPSMENTDTAQVSIQINGVIPAQVDRFNAMTDSGCANSFLFAGFNEDLFPQFQICTRNRQIVRVEFVLDDPNLIENLSVTLIRVSEDYPSIDGISEADRTLSFVPIFSSFVPASSTPTVSVRVFLEGILNDQ